MFSKLYKYQIKELWFIARYFYLAMTGTILIGLFISETRIPGVVQFFNTLLLIGFIICGIAIIIFTITHDYQNQQGKRSYFFRSIPAKESVIIGSRLSYYLTYYFATVIVLAIGIAIFTISHTAINMMLPFHIAFSIIKDIFFQTKIIGMLLFIIVYAVFHQVISMMFAITIGSHARLKSLGIGGPILVYFLHYVAMQILTLISMLFIPISIKLPENPDTGFEFRIVFESMMPEMSKLFSAQSNEIKYIGIGFIFTTFIVWIIMAIWIYKCSKNKISLN
ncbi:MAG TPA: hypothetical protein GXZ43_03630 [Clostridiaceae bacterium]|nr:hypothetical protein [Clostridiaceae bacterium]